MEKLMANCTSRGRVKKTLAHEQPDRVPIDIGGDAGIVPSTYEKLCKYLGIYDYEKPRGIWSVENIDERVLEKLGSDCRHILIGSPQPERISNGLWRQPWGFVLSKEGYCPAEYAPLKNAQNVKDIEKYPYWPNPEDAVFTEGKREEARRLYENTDYAIVAFAGYAGTTFHMYSYLRGFENWLLDMKTNPEFYHALADKIADIAIKISKRYFATVADYVDIIHYDEDMGSQISPLISIEDFRKFVKPWMKRYHDEISKLTNAKFMLHSCGSVCPLINEFIEIGFDLLNPVQPRARNMEPERLKEKFGEKLCFLGGIDTQRLLPFGTVSEIRKEVNRVVSILGKTGGYIFATSNEIPAGVPPRNIVTLFEAAKEFG